MNKDLNILTKEINSFVSAWHYWNPNWYYLSDNLNIIDDRGKYILSYLSYHQGLKVSSDMFDNEVSLVYVNSTDEDPVALSVGDIVYCNYQSTQRTGTPTIADFIITKSENTHGYSSAIEWTNGNPSLVFRSSTFLFKSTGINTQWQIDFNLKRYYLYEQSLNKLENQKINFSDIKDSNNVSLIEGALCDTVFYNSSDNGIEEIIIDTSFSKILQSNSDLSYTRQYNINFNSTGNIKPILRIY